MYSTKYKYLIKWYGAFFIEGNVGLVLEYMDKGSLKNLISYI